MTIFVAVPIVAVVGEPVGYPSHATLATPDYIPMQNVHSARPIIRLTTIHSAVYSFQESRREFPLTTRTP